MVLVFFVSIPLTIFIVLFSPVFIILKYTILVLRNPVSSASTICKPLQYLNAHEAQYLYQDQKDLAVFHSILILDPSINLESIRDVVTSRIVESKNNEGFLLYPRFLQTLLFTSLGPAWLKEQSSFDIKNHVYPGPPIHTENDLRIYLSSLMARRLSFNFPPWEMIVIFDYGEDHDVVLICRVHQCLTDGAALVKMLSQSLADNTSGSITKKSNFAGTVFGFNLLRAMTVGTLTAINWLWWSKSESKLFRKVCLKNINYSEHSQLEPIMHKNKDTVINISQKSVKSNSEKKKKSEGTSISVVHWSDTIAVNDVLRIKQIIRTSFNDIILSVLTGALRKTLQKFGQIKLNDIKINVAVDLRKNKNLQDQNLDPKVSLVPVSIPLSCEGAVPRIWEIQKTMGTMKGSCDSVIGYGLSCLLPQSIAGRLQRRLQHRTPLHFSSISVPTHPISLGGSRVKAVFAINPTASALNVTVVTYFGRVYVTVAIKRSIPQASKLGSTILRNFDNQMLQLSKQMSRRRLPRSHKGNGQQRSDGSLSNHRPATLQGLDGSLHNTNIKHLEQKLLLVQQELLTLKDASEDQLNTKNNLLTDHQDNAHSHGAEDISLKMLNLKNEFTAILSEINRAKCQSREKAVRSPRMCLGPMTQ